MCPDKFMLLKHQLNWDLLSHSCRQGELGGISKVLLGFWLKKTIQQSLLCLSEKSAF